MNDESRLMLKELGHHIKRLRERQGLTLMDLEIKSGINNGDISKIEGGKINLAFTTLVKLANGLSISLAEIVTF